MIGREKIHTFTNLVAWQEAHKLVLLIYSKTENFPKKETFGIIDQLRRASVSISSNIAEGFSKKTQADKRKFYYMSLSSTTEVQNQILIARDIKYLEEKTFFKIAKRTIVVHKLINGLIKSAENKPHT